MPAPCSSWKVRICLGLACAGSLGCARPSPTRTSNVVEAFAEFQRVRSTQQDTAASCSVSGRLFEALHGKPLAHALVLASLTGTRSSSAPERNQPEPLTLTDNDGRWTLSLETSRTYELVASAA